MSRSVHSITNPTGSSRRSVAKTSVRPGKSGMDHAGFDTPVAPRPVAPRKPQGPAVRRKPQSQQANSARVATSGGRVHKGFGAVSMILLLLTVGGGGLFVGSGVQSILGAVAKKEQVIVARATPKTDFSF